MVQRQRVWVYVGAFVFLALRFGALLLFITLLLLLRRYQGVLAIAITSNELSQFASRKAQF